MSESKMVFQKLPKLDPNDILQKVKEEVLFQNNEKKFDIDVHSHFYIHEPTLTWRVAKYVSFALREMGFHRTELTLKKFLSPYVKRHSR